MRVKAGVHLPVSLIKTLCSRRALLPTCGLGASAYLPPQPEREVCFTRTGRTRAFPLRLVLAEANAIIIGQRRQYSVMQVMKAGAVYSALVFAVGFVLGGS